MYGTRTNDIDSGKSIVLIEICPLTLVASITMSEITPLDQALDRSLIRTSDWTSRTVNLIQLQQIPVS